MKQRKMDNQENGQKNKK